MEGLTKAESKLLEKAKLWSPAYWRSKFKREIPLRFLGLIPITALGAYKFFKNDSDSEWWLILWLFAVFMAVISFYNLKIQFTAYSLIAKLANSQNNSSTPQNETRTPAAGA